METNIKERQYLRLPLSVGCGLLCLSSNQITGFFYHQYIGKVSINLFDFLYGDNQGKVASETITFGWLKPAVPLVKSDCRILWSSIYLERIKWYLSFIPCSYLSRDGSIWDYYFGWVQPVASLVQLDCRIILSSVSQERVDWYCCFFMKI